MSTLWLTDMIKVLYLSNLILYIFIWTKTTTALGLIFSSSLNAQDTIGTALKMLINVCQYPDDPRFSSIRLQNPAFQNKIASVSGGVDLFLAAGEIVNFNINNI